MARFFAIISMRTLRQAAEKAAEKDSIAKRITPLAFRPSFVTHLLENHSDDGCSASGHTVRELLGHRDARATLDYTHILDRGGPAVRSPLDSPAFGGRPGHVI
jgi:integrase